MGIDSKSLPEAVLSKISAKERKPLGKAGRTASECQEVQVAKSERELQNQIESLLRRRGYIPARQRMDKKSNVQVGYPDIFFACCGRAVFWEVKLPGKQLDQEQMMVITRINAFPNKGICFVIYSYAEAVACLDNLEREFNL